MLIGFHFGTWCTVQAITSVISRRLGAGGKMYVPRERYSLMMSFCVVPVSSPSTPGPDCSCATVTYSASSHIAGALIVMEVLASASGMPSKRRRMSPRCATGTPTLPTSPLASGWSAS